MFDEFEDFDEAIEKKSKKGKKKRKNKDINDDFSEKKNGKKLLLVIGGFLLLALAFFGIYKAFSSGNLNFNKKEVVITLEDGVSPKQTLTILATGDYGALPEPVREGYTFDGWYTQKEGGVVVTGLTSYKSVNANTLYAHWKANKYKLTFILDNGEENIVLEQDFGSKIEAPKNFSRANYTFNGWSEAVPETVLAKDMEFKATWIPNTYNVYFNSNGGSSVSNKGVSYGGVYGALPVPSKDRYEFQGWYFDNVTFNNQLTNNSEVRLTSDVTVYAKWKLLTPRTLKVNTSGGFDSKLITSYSDYKKLGDRQLSETDFYTSSYILVALNIDPCTDEVVSVDGYQVNGEKVVVNVSVKRHCNSCGLSRVYYLYEVSKNSFGSNKRIVSKFNISAQDAC